MKIILDDNYYIDVDDRNHTLIKKGINQNEKGKNFGKETLTTIGYYSNLGQAVLNYLNHCELDEIEEITIKDYIESYKNKCDEVIKKLGETK